MVTRIVPLVLLLLLVAIHAQLWAGRGSVGNVQDLRQQIAAQQAANAQARLANERLAAEVNDLKGGLEMVEEKARGELGMVKQGEIYVQVVRPAQR
ncbi:cell division protein FtsB [Alicycliphilus denitrificans]|uniref:Cell division protein FtsB n=2 Tax=Alicycliphilus denitrificans TaxID=179636 RepID=F4GF18_ALIDK|nr:cell division protein FtsB [Alicycliphilus denitrificans]ADU98854.1 Septum formation initiator [Alicycliphilus denitrificans BC]AEB86122.1 Septum formation initiator [Alicycliphilus denitrificans K601]QKD43213.1 cell division protein FtsB [Alicycliphilus denitrificans]